MKYTHFDIVIFEAEQKQLFLSTRITHQNKTLVPSLALPSGDTRLGCVRDPLHPSIPGPELGKNYSEVQADKSKAGILKPPV